MKEPNQNVTFEQLIAKVKRAEDVLEARERGVATSYQHLRQVWRQGHRQTSKGGISSVRLNVE